ETSIAEAIQIPQNLQKKPQGKGEQLAKATSVTGQSGASPAPSNQSGTAPATKNNSDGSNAPIQDNASDKPKRKRTRSRKRKPSSDHHDSSTEGHSDRPSDTPTPQKSPARE